MLSAAAAGLLGCFLLWGFADITAAPALQFNLGVTRWLLIAAATAFAALPPVTAVIQRLFAFAERPSAVSRAKIACVVSIIAATYLIVTAHLQGRDLFPKTHDDQSYLLQIQMLARLRLWMPQHPLADFFDTFYVISKPVYASLYFPGASLLYVPTVWLGLPTWFLPTCVAGACVGLTYRIVAELVDGASGLLAALALLSLEYFRVFSVLLTSHEPMLLLGLLTTVAWLRWRSARSSAGGRSWVRLAAGPISIGVFAGWAAITRPADAVCFALPVGVALLLDCFRPEQGTDNERPVSRVRSAGMVLGLIVLGATPFLALQAVFNKGVTGNWLETPYTFYLKQEQPNTSFGFHAYDPSARPASNNQRKLDYYDQFFAPYIVRHQPAENLRWWGKVYLPMTVDTTLPTRLALPLAAIGALAVFCSRRRWAVVGVIPLFLLLYYFNTFFLEHYAILIAPAMLLLVVLGIRRCADAWPARASSIRASLSAGLVVTSLLILPEFNALWPEQHQTGDETMTSSVMRFAKVDMPLAGNFKSPAIVLFAYRFGDSIVEEPVYNSDVAWPDDAPLIYAHDLGARNAELFRYYALRQPERRVYRFDRHSAEGIEDLGRVADLAARADQR